MNPEVDMCGQKVVDSLHCDTAQLPSGGIRVISYPVSGSECSPHVRYWLHAFTVGTE